MRLDTIVAYTYRADNVCPLCVVSALGIEARAGSVNVEDLLDALASARGIDRYDETSYDSGDFPKVVFADMIESEEHCGNCGEVIEH